MIFGMSQECCAAIRSILFLIWDRLQLVPMGLEIAEHKHGRGEGDQGVKNLWPMAIRARE